MADPALMAPAYSDGEEASQAPARAQANVDMSPAAAAAVKAENGSTPEPERTTDPMVFYRQAPFGRKNQQCTPSKVVAAVSIVRRKELLDAYERNLATAYQRRVCARYPPLPEFRDIFAMPGTPDSADERLSAVHGDRFFGPQGPQRRVYEVMGLCNDVLRYRLPVPPDGVLQRLDASCAKKRVFRGRCQLFGRIMRSLPKAVFLKRALADDLSIPFAEDTGMSPYLDELALVGGGENEVVDVDRSPRMNVMPEPVLAPMFPEEHRRAEIVRFSLRRCLFPTV
eukprot:TRINITY_DN3614_c0_g1_i3.p1 TRINITY_DN3614_c0_g1~~TRINITY_DN3614_c0_g1_i3.p1  ORF type:complete len:283 (-),score=20.65 TRINITY_DN3614_c0_g1_i3:220-1068(-)